MEGTIERPLSRGLKVRGTEQEHEVFALTCLVCEQCEQCDALRFDLHISAFIRLHHSNSGVSSPKGLGVSSPKGLGVSSPKGLSVSSPKGPLPGGPCFDSLAG